MTMPEGKSLSWNGGRMNVGDSISLQFTDVNEPSQPLSPKFVADCMKKTSMEGDDTKEWDFYKSICKSFYIGYLRFKR